MEDIKDKIPMFIAVLGVHTLEEVSFDELPSKVKEKYSI